MFIGSFGDENQYGLYWEKYYYIIKQLGLDLSETILVRVDIKELLDLHNLIGDAIDKTINDPSFKGGR